MSLSADSIAASAPKGVSKVLSREARTKALQCALFLGSSSAKLALRGGAKGLSLSADSVAYAASAPKGVSKVLAAKLELKLYSVLIPSAGIKDRPTRDRKEPLR